MTDQAQQSPEAIQLLKAALMHVLVTYHVTHASAEPLRRIYQCMAGAAPRKKERKEKKSYEDEYLGSRAIYNH